MVSDAGRCAEPEKDAPPRSRLKAMVWSLRTEVKAIALAALCAMPFRIGVWMRARLLPAFLGAMGANTTVHTGLRVTMPQKVRIGSHCHFGPDIFITGGGGVTIGDWVGFGPDVKVWSVNHRFEDPDTPWLLQGWESKPVFIEDDVWLAANVFVMPGVRIGRGAVVSAGSVVSKSVAPYAIVAGNPGRVVGWRKRPDGEAAVEGA